MLLTKGMAVKYFPHPIDGRTITVKVDKEHNSIDFEFKNGHWFYDIPVNEWVNDYPRWQDHMKQKNWFSEKMVSFINEQTK